MRKILAVMTASIALLAISSSAQAAPITVSELQIRSQAYTMLECSARASIPVSPTSKQTVRAYSCHRVGEECFIGAPLRSDTGKCLSRYEMRAISPSGLTYSCSVMMYFRKAPGSITRIDRNIPKCFRLVPRPAGSIQLRDAEEIASDFNVMQCVLRETDQTGRILSECKNDKVVCRVGIPLSNDTASCTLTFYLQAYSSGKWLYCKSQLYLRLQGEDNGLIYIGLVNSPKYKCTSVSAP